MNEDDDLAAYAVQRPIQSQDDDLSAYAVQSTTPAAPKVSRKDAFLDRIKPKSVASNALMKGLAGTVDVFGNAIPNAINLAAIPVHAGASAVGLTDKPFTPPVQTDNTARMMEQAGLIDQNMNPVTENQQLLDKAIQGGTQFALTGKPSVSAFGLGALSTAAGEKVKQETGSELAGAIANIATASALPSSINAAKQYGQGLVAKKQAALDKTRMSNAEIDKTLKQSIDEGYTVPPAMVKGSKERLVNKIAGKAETESEASVRNQLVTEKLARRDLGIADDMPITTEFLQAKRQALGQSYEKLKKQDDFIIDPEYKPNKFSPPIDRSVGLDMQQKSNIKASDAVEHIKQLRADADAIFSSATKDPAMLKDARSFRKEADNLEGLIERNLEKAGKKSVLDEFRKARAEIAKTHLYEDAIIEGSGTIDPKVFGKALQRGEFLSGDAKKIGVFYNNFPKANKPASQIASKNSGQLMPFLAPTGGGSVGAGIGSIFGPVGAAVGGGIGTAAALYAPTAARNYVLSPSQQAAMIPNYKAPQNALSTMRPYSQDDITRLMIMSDNALRNR